MTGTLHRRALIGALIGAAAPVSAVAQERDVLAAMPLDQHGWSAAATPPDGVGWNVLGATRSEERTIDGFSMLLPVFTPRVRALAGRRVRVNGFMLPLEETPRQSRFLLMAYPTSCPFHLSVGAEFCIDVRAAAPVPVTYDAFQMEGVFTLLERDPEGLFYRMTDARMVR